MPSTDAVITQRSL